LINPNPNKYTTFVSVENREIMVHLALVDAVVAVVEYFFGANN
jgi:hypothetical protein